MRKEILSGILSIIKTVSREKKKLANIERARGSENGKPQPRLSFPLTRIIKSGLKEFLLNI